MTGEIFGGNTGVIQSFGSHNPLVSALAATMLQDLPSLNFGVASEVQVQSASAGGIDLGSFGR